VCGLRTRISEDPDLQIFLRTRTVRGSAKQTHLQTRTIRGSKATSIVCRTNLERKYQCTSSQQFENWSTFGHCSRPSCYVRKPVWLCEALSIVYWIQCNLTLLVDADGPRIWVTITVADADRLRTWCLRTRIIRGREICGSAHLWCKTGLVAVWYRFTRWRQVVCCTGFNDETPGGTYSTKWYDQRRYYALLHYGELHDSIPVYALLPLLHTLLPVQSHTLSCYLSTPYYE